MGALHRDVTEGEIEFFGDKDELNKIKSILAEKCIIHERESIDLENISGIKFYPSFNLGSYNLYKNIQNKTISQVILKFIDDNQVAISPRNRYLLQYFDYEAKMIDGKKSKHKSCDNPRSGHLSSPVMLNAILDECEKKNYLPGFEQLFQFLENSEKMKHHYLDYFLYFEKSSFKIDTNEIDQFIKKDENNLLITENENKTCRMFSLLLFDRKLVKISEEYIPEEQNKKVLSKN